MDRIGLAIIVLIAALLVGGAVNRHLTDTVQHDLDTITGVSP